MFICRNGSAYIDALAHRAMCMKEKKGEKGRRRKTDSVRFLRRGDTAMKNKQQKWHRIAFILSKWGEE